MKNWNYILVGANLVTSWTAFDSDATIESNKSSIRRLSLAGSISPGAFCYSNEFTLTASEVLRLQINLLNCGANFKVTLNNKSTADDTSGAYDVDTYVIPSEGNQGAELTATTSGNYRMYIRRVDPDGGTHSFDNGRFIISQFVELTNAPIGWDEKILSFIRHEFYNSVLRNLSLSFKFPFEGKDFILSRYDAYGINYVITVIIEKRDTLTDVFSHYYSGILDLSKLSIERDIVEVPIIDNQILAKFISRDNLDINLNELLTLDNDVITEFSGGFEQLAEISGVDIITQSYANLRSEETIVYTGQNFDYNSPVKFPALTSFLYSINENPDDAITDKSTFKLYTNNSSESIDIEFEININIIGTMSIVSGNNVTLYLKAWVYTDGLPTPEYLINYSNTGLSGTQSVNVDESEVPIYTGITLAPGHSLYIKMQSGASDTIKSGTTSANLEVDSFKVNIRKVIPTWSYIDRNVFLPHEVLTRILQKLTGADAVLSSNLLGRIDLGYAADGEFAYHSISSGYMLRDYLLEDKPYSTNLRDFFKSINAITPVGLWYNESIDKWELKNIDNYYNNNVIISLGEVAEFRRSSDEKYYFNSIKSGYSKNISYEQKSISNFNCSFEYSNNITTVKNTLDLQSTYRADDYGIAYVGIDTDKTKENNADNDTFWIVLDGSLKTIQGFDFYSVTELFNWKTRLNLEITPKRNLLRHGQELAITFWKEITGKIKYQKSQYNQKLTSQKTISDDIIVELADIDIIDLPEPLFHPEIYTFKAPVTSDQIGQLLADPHGTVEFLYLGNTYYGYIIEVSTEVFNNKGNWVLIKANTSRLGLTLTNDSLEILTTDTLETIYF